MFYEKDEYRHRCQCPSCHLIELAIPVVWRFAILMGISSVLSMEGRNKPTNNHQLVNYPIQKYIIRKIIYRVAQNFDVFDAFQLDC